MCGMGGMWIFPIIGITLVLVVLYLIFRQGNTGPPQVGSDPSHGTAEESALDILKTRYAKGEISKDEFEQMKKDIL